MATIDLDAGPPPFKVKFNGEEKEFDACELSLKLAPLRELRDSAPEQTLEAIRRATGLELTSYQAIVFLGELNKFVEEHLGPPFRRLFGDALFSAPTTVSPPKSSENSNQKST